MLLNIFMVNKQRKLKKKKKKKEEGILKRKTLECMGFKNRS